jgi:hypothetical protein
VDRIKNTLPGAVAVEAQRLVGGVVEETAKNMEKNPNLILSIFA